MSIDLTPELIRVTPAALARVGEVLGPRRDRYGLEISVGGEYDGRFTHELIYMPLDLAGDATLDWHDDIALVVPAHSVDVVRGAVLDLPEPDNGGLVVKNPNHPRPFGNLEDLDLSGPPEAAITALIEQRINPALRAHDGHVELDRFEGGTAYLSMGGGCHGCSLSAVTLQDNIATVLRRAIPAVKTVVDVTDHGNGTNPFFG